ncbi:transketolase [Sulfuricurvum sp.]|uniref:transketolase n=1 Tax=Sulfuricurvum sp. TaxID=2025608 RepID=UPI003BB58123
MTPSEFLENKANEIRKETLLIHKRAIETRVASSLSPIEVFVALYYGGVLKYNPKIPLWEGRDRFVISKGHGSISMYPILADLGFFDKSELENVCKPGSFLGGIPDPIIPGYETINGSLGHGLGVASGMAVALRAKNSDSSVFVLVGDGELNEGSNWEAIMFAAHNRLDNLIVIVDENKVSMLDFTKNILDISPLAAKFEAFGFECFSVEGHDVASVQNSLLSAKEAKNKKPKVVLAQTLKGKGVPFLESHPLSHILSLKPDEVDEIVRGLDARD